MIRIYHSHPGGVTNSYSASSVVPLNEFNRLALVWDPSIGAEGQIRIYVNGTSVLEIDGKSYWDDAPACGWNFMIGGRDVDTPWGFIGQIDEVRYSNYALEPNEFLNYQE